MIKIKDFLGNRNRMVRIFYALQWRHNERECVSNHRFHDCLLTLLFRRRSKKTSKLCVTGLCEGNLPKMFPFDDVIMVHCYHT